MAISWITFALIYPALLALINIVDKFLLDKRIRDYRCLCLVVGFVALPAAIAIMLLASWDNATPARIGLGLFSGLLIAISYPVYFRILSTEEVSRVISIYYAAPILVTFFSAAILRETLPWWKYVAIIAAAAGAVLIGIKRFERIPVMRKGFWMLMLMCVFVGITSTISKYLLQSLSIWNIIGLELVGVSSLIIYLFSSHARKHARTALKSLHLIMFSEYTTYAAWLLWAAATAQASVALVSAMGSLQPLYVLLLMLALSTFMPHILKEAFTKKTLAIKAIAVLMIVIGTFFVAL